MRLKDQTQSNKRLDNVSKRSIWSKHSKTRLSLYEDALDICSWRLYVTLTKCYLQWRLDEFYKSIQVNKDQMKSTNKH